MSWHRNVKQHFNYKIPFSLFPTVVMINWQTTAFNICKIRAENTFQRNLCHLNGCQGFCWACQALTSQLWPGRVHPLPTDLHILLHSWPNESLENKRAALQEKNWPRLNCLLLFAISSWHEANNKHSLVYYGIRWRDDMAASTGFIKKKTCFL